MTSSALTAQYAMRAQSRLLQADLEQRARFAVPVGDALSWRSCRHEIIARLAMDQTKPLKQAVDVVRVEDAQDWLLKAVAEHRHRLS